MSECWELLSGMGSVALARSNEPGRGKIKTNTMGEEPPTIGHRTKARMPKKDVAHQGK